MKWHVKNALVVAALLAPLPAMAAENTLKKALWVEGGSTTKGSYSVAVGTRLGPVGMKFGYGGDSDFESKEVFDAHPFSPAELGVTASPIGRKRIDPAFGFDVVGFYDLTQNLSGYAELGPYFQEVRNVMVVTGTQRSVLGRKGLSSTARRSDTP
ncbi:hypothetical protein [Geobacter anodireducens]